MTTLDPGRRAAIEPPPVFAMPCSPRDRRTFADAIVEARTVAARLALLPAVIATCETVTPGHHTLTPARLALGGAVVTDARASAIGALAYMPPERVRGEPVDERADVYALGAILYHLLAGVPPFRARRATELIEDVASAEPLPLALAAPATPRALVSIVGKAMARDPAARYASARALADELVRFQTGGTVEAHLYTSTERVQRFVLRRRRMVLAAVGVAVVVGLGIAHAVRSRAYAREVARAQLVEQGRAALLGGDAARALASLREARDRGARGDVVEFLLDSALAEPASTVSPPASARVVGASRDGSLVVTDDDRDVAVWTARGVRVSTSLASPIATSHARVAATTPAGVAIVGATGELARIDLPERPARLELSADGGRLAIMWAERAPEVWDVANRKRLAVLAHADRVLLDDTGMHAIAWRTGALPVVWNVDAGVAQIALPAVAAEPVGFALGGARVVLREGTATSVWTTAGTRILVHAHTPAAPTIDPTGRWLVTIDDSREIAVWSLETGERRSAFTGRLRRATPNGDATLLAGIADDGRAVVVDASDGRVLARHAPAVATWWTPERGRVVLATDGFTAWRANRPERGGDALDRALH